MEVALNTIHSLYKLTIFFNFYSNIYHIRKMNSSLLTLNYSWSIYNTSKLVDRKPKIKWLTQNDFEYCKCIYPCKIKPHPKRGILQVCDDTWDRTSICFSSLKNATFHLLKVKRQLAVLPIMSKGCGLWWLVTQGNIFWYSIFQP